MYRFAFTTLLALVPALAHAQGTVVDLDGLKSSVPAEWKQAKINNGLRKYQFSVPKAEGDKEDAELVIFHFGKGGGGGVEANLERWKSMFDSKEAGKVEKFKVGEVPVTLLDVKGTYKSKFPPAAPNAKTILKDDFRMLNAVFQSDEGPYFIRLVGPERTVNANEKAFVSWIKKFQ